jgi:hypothetical protein
MKIDQRFFAFGCSFTNSKYPTWADIVGYQYKAYSNWGQAGAGNSFIFYSLMECHKRNTITQDDVVMIMWSSIGREDRWVKGEQWITPGSIYNQTTYSEDFVEKFADPTGYLIRDMAHLTAAKAILDAIGCKYKFFSIVPFNVPDDNIFKIFSIDNKITTLYADELAVVKPSVYEAVFNCNWYSRKGYVDLAGLKSEYNVIRGDSWPTWEQFTQQDFNGVSDRVREEIDEKYEFSRRFLFRTNTHPMPAEYLLYLNTVAPEVEIHSDTAEWTRTVNEMIMTEQSLRRVWAGPQSVRRF